MPTKKRRASVRKAARSVSATVSAATDDLLLAALERGGDSLETGRYIVTYRDQAADEGVRSLKARGLRIVDARDFKDQAVTIEDVGDADALSFPEIGAAVIGSAAMARGMEVSAEVSESGPIEAIEPEYFVFANDHHDYLRGFARAAEAISGDLGTAVSAVLDEADDVESASLGATWGLIACKVPPSTRSGLNIKVAVLDTGMDLRHPDFAGRVIVSKSFVGQPVQDLPGHATHLVGTACGPKTPPGTTPRYGIGYRTHIYVGKVLSNSGSGSTAGVLAGINWAIANRCPVILMSFGAQTPVQAAYTAAGNAALSKGCLIVAAAGSSGSTGAPANSPSIMAVASLDPNLTPSSFSSSGKIEIAAPGRDVFSAVSLPRRYATLSGTSMAASHVAGCAALWAQTSTSLRGMALWRKLQATAKHLPYPPSRVGAGLVQAPK